MTFTDAGFQATPQNFDPNSIPGDDHTDADIDAMVQQWFQEQQQGDGNAASQTSAPAGEAPATSPAGTIPPLPPVQPIDEPITAPAPEPPDPWAHLTREQRQELLDTVSNLSQWAAAHPNEAQYVDGLIQGRFTLPSSTQSPAPAPTVTQPAQPTPGLPPNIQADIEAVKAVTRSMWQAQQAERTRSINDIYNTTVMDFQTQNNLNKEQMEKLIQATSQSGLVGALASQGHAPGDAIRKALDYNFSTNPEFSQHRTILTEAKNAEQQRRANKQAALVGASGSTTRSPVAPRQPTGDRLTEQGRITAIANLIRENQAQ